MTGFILKRFADRIEILSDGAVYLPDGTVIGVAYKVESSDTVPLAIVGSGATADIEALSMMILYAADVAGTVDGALEIVSASLADLAPVAAYDKPVRIAIAAISETDGPKCLVFSTYLENGVQPFALLETSTGFGQGALPSGDELLAMGFKRGDSQAGLEEHGPTLFEYMRRKKLINPASPDEAPSYKIGGHLDLTVVRPEGVTTKRLHTWPDAIGEKIDPFKENVAAA